MYNCIYHKYNIPFRYSDELSIGDDVLLGEDYELIPVQVINISSITMKGNICYTILSFIFRTNQTGIQRSCQYMNMLMSKV